MFVISEADYEARKRSTIDRPKNTDDAKKRKQGLVTAGEMARVRELDNQVDTVISSLKSKGDLKEDAASSTTGVVVVQNHDVCMKHPSEQHAQSPISKCQCISTKGLTLRKRRQTWIVALGLLLRSL